MTTPKPEAKVTPPPARPNRTGANGTSPPTAPTVDPVPSTVLMEKKRDANSPLPVFAPKQIAIAAPPPPPKPVIDTPKPPAPAAPAVVTKPKEELVTPAIPGVIPPALRQPKSVVDASNALAKVELLRPPATNSAPPAKPLEARVIETKPALPKATNATVIATKPAPPVAPTPTHPSAAKPATNATVVASPTPKTIPIIVPTNAPKQFAKALEPKIAAPKLATNAPPRIANTTAAVVLPLLKGEGRGEGKGVVVSTAPATAAPKPAQPDAKKVSPAPEAKTNTIAAKPAKAAGQLAVASPAARPGGWAYLVAAVSLLVVAGGIIAHLLRPRPHPSVISQSLDDKRV